MLIAKYRQHRDHWGVGRGVCGIYGLRAEEADGGDCEETELKVKSLGGDDAMRGKHGEEVRMGVMVGLRRGLWKCIARYPLC